MTMAARGLALGVALSAALLAWAGGEDERFMPPGGRTLLLQALGPAPDAQAVRQILGTTNSEAQWAEFARTRAASASPREQATLAAYLSLNLPLVVAPGADNAQALLAALPRDGRELAWNQCQFCHSLFTSHLTQQRDLQGWRNVFLSPFHRELKMTPQEREEFARYSAINMPMKVEDVPTELRY